MAMALVRCSSRVLSAISAVMAAEIAPAPWIARPTMTQPMWLAMAATREPLANSRRPMMMMRFRP
jgi:hypothetical protein